MGESNEGEEEEVAHRLKSARSVPELGMKDNASSNASPATTSPHSSKQRYYDHSYGKNPSPFAQYDAVPSRDGTPAIRKAGTSQAPSSTSTTRSGHETDVVEKEKDHRRNIFGFKRNRSKEKDPAVALTDNLRPPDWTYRKGSQDTIDTQFPTPSSTPQPEQYYPDDYPLMSAHMFGGGKILFGNQVARRREPSTPPRRDHSLDGTDARANISNSSENGAWPTYIDPNLNDMDGIIKAYDDIHSISPLDRTDMSNQSLPDVYPNAVATGPSIVELAQHLKKIQAQQDQLRDRHANQPYSAPAIPFLNLTDGGTLDTLNPARIRDIAPFADESNLNQRRPSVLPLLQASKEPYESWQPPESWAVLSPTRHTYPSGEDSTSSSRKSSAGHIMEHTSSLTTSSKRRPDYCIRIFRPDGTFATLSCSPQTTAGELVQMMHKKLWLKKGMPHSYAIFLQRGRLRRLLDPSERPLVIQIDLLEKMGYNLQDRLEDVGREDHSYLIRFTFSDAPVPNSIDDLDQFGDFTYVGLHNRNLPAVPISLYKRAGMIQILDLSKNLHIELPNDFIQLCTSLTELRLSGNDMSAIPSSLRHLSSLRRLDLSCNRLEDVEDGPLDNMQQLEAINFCSNQLTDLPTYFAYFNRLHTLNLSNNNLRELPILLCEMISLKDLDISFNDIESLPANIGNLTKLERFNALANHLQGELPPSFAELRNLKELDLRQNAITDLECVSQLPYLELLQVDYNAVSVVDCRFRYLKQLKMSKNNLTQFNLSPTRSLGDHTSLSSSLTDVNISNCKLSTLPEDVFDHVVGIKVLILDNNLLNGLPASIGGLRSLFQLSVKNNQLQQLPPQIGRLTQLKMLDVQQNNLMSLPIEIWLCAALVTLNCSSNLLNTFPDANTVTSSPMEPVATTDHMNQSIPADSYEFDSVQVSGFKGSTMFNSSRKQHPMSYSLKCLCLGDNRLTEDVFEPLSLFTELRILNLSFNRVYDIPQGGLCHPHLFELYLSGNHLTSVPAEDIEKLTFLRVLHLNGNKLQTLPAELGKLRKLLVLDVGNNTLKYNISNWLYDWNWNWNLELKYLNFSGNTKLEIKKSHQTQRPPADRNLSDFGVLTRLRVLGLMDVTLLVTVPDESEDRRIRTSTSEVNSTAYGMADYLGLNEHLSTWDLVVPRFRDREDECLFGMFESRGGSKSGCKIAHHLNMNFATALTSELKYVRPGEGISVAMRRTFLGLEKDMGLQLPKESMTGSSAVVAYLSGTRLCVTNVGDSMAVMARTNGQSVKLTKRHLPLDPTEIRRIKASYGYVSTSGMLDNDIPVSKCFGFWDHLPAMNASPHIVEVELSDEDEFLVIASRVLWDKMSHQTVIDIISTEKDDLMLAAQKVRDFAITYGTEDSLMIMIVGVSDLFDKRDKKFRTPRGGSSSSRNSDTGPFAESAQASVAALTRRGGRSDLGADTVDQLPKEVPPPIGEVAMCFSDIRNSTLLWETVPEAMQVSMRVHNTILRKQLRSLGGYEIRTEGDAFMVCFQTITAALLWCLTVQIELLDADWPKEILETTECQEIVLHDRVLYRGLSVRMGVHFGTPVYEIDPITQRMDYYGPMVNRGSRISSAADGGQIFVSSDVLVALDQVRGLVQSERSGLQPPNPHIGDQGRQLDELDELKYGVMTIGGRKLKGLETPEVLHMIFPARLADRCQFDKTIVTLARQQGAMQETLETIVCFDHSKDHHVIRGTSRASDKILIRSLGILTIRIERAVANTIHQSDDLQPDTRRIIQTRLLTFDIPEHASEMELFGLIEHLVTRIENAVNALYLYRVGGFSSSLGRLGEALDIDPIHIVRALQMYTIATQL